MLGTIRRTSDGDGAVGLFERLKRNKAVMAVTIGVCLAALLVVLFLSFSNSIVATSFVSPHSENDAAPHPTKVSGDRELDEMLDAAIGDGIGEGDNALRNAYEYVASRFTYLKQEGDPEGDWREWSKEYAKELYRNGEGNCYRSASLMCWLARRLGYDASVVVGTVPTDHGPGAHAWVEVEKDGVTYLIDATFHRSMAERDFFMRTYDEAPASYTK